MEDLIAGFEPVSQLPAIEELIARDVPATDILRLLCLQSLVGGPIKPKDTDNIRKQFLQVPPNTSNTHTLTVPLNPADISIGIWLPPPPNLRRPRTSRPPLITSHPVHQTRILHPP